MRVLTFRSFLLLFMGLWLTAQITTGLAAAETAHGTLLVSMTVLPSCQINVNSRAAVACPVNYPFRASLTTSSSSSSNAAGRVFTGESQVELSRLSASTDPSLPAGIRMLTISY